MSENAVKTSEWLLGPLTFSVKERLLGIVFQQFTKQQMARYLHLCYL